MALIECVGITWDGKVFVRMSTDIAGEKMTGMLELDPPAAEKFAGDLIDAAKQAVKGIVYEQNSPGPD